MGQVPWTYELPSPDSFDENLDGYEVQTAEGMHAGIASGLVARDGELYLLVDAGRLPPLVHRRLAFRFADVARVDHDALAVRLAVDRGRFEEVALALDPVQARHGPGAEAHRVHALPAGMAPPAAPGREGPVEPDSSLAALVLATLVPYLLLAVIAFWVARGLTGWEHAVFALPLLATLAAFAAAGYRLYRAPHLGHRPRT